MPFIDDEVFDSGLDNLDTGGTRLDINFGSEATTYDEATNTKSCGNDTVNTGAPEPGTPSGRMVTIPEITAGTVSDTQTAGWWSLTDGATKLWAAGELSATQDVTSGNTFTLDAITIAIIDAVSV